MNRRCSSVIQSLFVILILACLQSPRAAVSLPSVIGDHMVLQQDQPIRLWGWATPGEEVRVTLLHRQTWTVANDAGEWSVELKSLKAGGPHTLYVSGSNDLEVKDVLIGEVWLCSGQSNMEWTLPVSENGVAEVKAANYPEIRLFRTSRALAPRPARDVKGQWQRCSPAAHDWKGPSKGFSAVGYFFGRELYRKLGRPIGLIEASWGGTMIEPWTPPAGFAAVPALKTYAQRAQLLLPGSETHADALAKLIDDQRDWVKSAKNALEMGEPAPEYSPMPRELGTERVPTDPSAIYNGMIAPLVPFGLRGAIWYQGEANHLDLDYTEKMEALVGGWREVWGRGEFPFYYVQIAPFGYGYEPDAILPRFWVQQANAERIPNTGMVVTNDIGEIENIHPLKKREVGERLAGLALARTYRKRGIVDHGPEYVGFKLEPGQLRLRFGNVAGGLAGRDGKPIKGFEIIDRDHGGFVPADARVERSSIVLTASAAPNPVAFTYAWGKLTQANLVNGAGLPMSAFRDGIVPERDRMVMEVPESVRYELVYDLDLTSLSVPVRYTVDRHAEITRPFKRVAYFLERGADEKTAEFVWVSLDAFTSDTRNLGVPVFGVTPVFRRNVTNLKMWSNSLSLHRGPKKLGRIEFWATDYSPANKDEVDHANDGEFDFSDTPQGNEPGHGSMQIHCLNTRQTVLAINNWRAGAKAELGIGSPPAGSPDWTFAGNADQYPYRRLRILVETTPEPEKQ